MRSCVRTVACYGRRMKKLIPFLFLFACGGEAFEGDEPDGFAPLEHVEIGQAVQGFKAKHSTTFQFGSSTGGAHLACTRTSSAQVCSIPKVKTIEVAKSSSFDAVSISLINNATAAVDGALSFTYPLKNAADPIGAGNMRMVIQPGAVSGSLSSNIDGYESVTFVSPANLTEGVAEDDPVGQYQKHGACIANIDVQDILNKGTSSAQDDNLFKHAVAAAILTCSGLGLRTDSAVNGTYLRRAIHLDAASPAVSSGPVCMATSYNVTDNGDFSEDHNGACFD